MAGLSIQASNELEVASECLPASLSTPRGRRSLAHRTHPRECHENICHSEDLSIVGFGGVHPHPLSVRPYVKPPIVGVISSYYTARLRGLTELTRCSGKPKASMPETLTQSS
jgi:hypothetical protein